MSEETAAPVVAEAVSAPETPAPEAPSAPEATPERRPERTSSRDSIERAMAKVQAKDGTKELADRLLGEVQTKEPAKADDVTKPVADVTERPRQPDGKFAPKVEAVVDDEPPPSWLADNAKSHWGMTPKEIRSEYARRFGEMEKGLAEHQQKLNPLREYADLAERSGTTLDAALKNYVGIEQTLRTDPVKGFEALARNLGMDFRQFATWYAQQPAKTPEQINYERRLEAETAQRAALQQQNTDLASRLIDQFKALPQYNRFDELAGDIAKALQTGFASSLEEAYEFAARLKPAPQDPVAQTHGIPPAAQTLQEARTELSLDGNPGSNPATARSGNNREALLRAQRRVGLSL